MTLLRGHFAMMLVCRGDARPGRGRGGAGLADRRRHARRLGAGGARRGARASRCAPSYVADRARCRPARDRQLGGGRGWPRSGGNITDLTTRLAGGLYLLVAEVDLPDGVDVEALTSALRAHRGRARGRGDAAGPGERRPVTDPAPDPASARRAARRRRGALARGRPRRRGPGARGRHRPGDRAVGPGRRRSTRPRPRPCSSPPTWSPPCGSRPAASGWPRRRWASARGCSASTSASTPRPATHHGTFVLCNAEVVESSRNEKAREGCMSVPDLTGDVKRATRAGGARAAARHRRERRGRGRGLRGPGAAARDRPLRRAALPRPGGRGARRAPAQDVPLAPTAVTGPRSPTAEAEVLKTSQCGFDPHRGHHPRRCAPAAWEDAGHG